MGYTQVCKLLSIFLGVGVLRCIAIRDSNPGSDSTKSAATERSQAAIEGSHSATGRSQEIVETEPESTEPETRTYEGDVYLTLYKDDDCKQLRYHHRIRPGQCVRTNTDTGRKAGGRTLAYAVGFSKSPYNHALLSDSGELYMCKEGCEAKKCQPVPVDWPKHECIKPKEKIGAFIGSVTVGTPDASLQFFENAPPNCTEWFEKRKTRIWQNDVWFGDCFETKFPVMGFDFAIINKDFTITTCKDKACTKCNPGPVTYTKNACIDPYYVNEPANRVHNALRIRPYSKAEASTVMDDPACVKRIGMIHTAKDALKLAHKHVQDFSLLDKSCPTPTQNLALRNLFVALQDALRTEDVAFLGNFPHADSLIEEHKPSPGALELPQAEAASFADVQSAESGEPDGPVFLVTVYKDTECKQWRNHIKVTEKCTPLVGKLKGGMYEHAAVKLGKLYFCLPGCISCIDPDEETTACTVIGGKADYVKAVRIGKPELSVQFHQDPECPNWHDKRASHIWQHDMFFDNCFPAWAPINRKDLKYGFVTKNEEGESKLLSCSDKACESCQSTHYEFGKCENASYIDMPTKAQHKAIRMKTWEPSEAATVYDEFPQCLDRVNRAHEAMDLVNDAINKTDAVNKLEPSCESPKQDKDMWNLGAELRGILTSLRPYPRYW